MPELPEVETVVNTLKRLIVGSRIEKVLIRYDLIRSKEFFVDGQTINDITRRGKYLVFHLDDYYMISHLRMEGKYFVKKDEPFEKHEHMIFYLNDDRTLRYHDVRKFGTFDLIDKSELSSFFQKLGPEPFDKEYNAKYLFNRKSRKPIKNFLLDQTVVAGIGNIYVNEICFITKIHPEKITSELTISQFEDIIKVTRKVLKKAIELGGTTIRSYTSSLGVTGRFQNELQVHGKVGLPCPVCGDLIAKIKVSGRGTYLCEKCQKR